MGSTSRFALRYPELTDAPNGPAQMSALASDVEGWLARAFRCTSTTRPGSPPNDMLIRESDTGNVMVWTGSAWAQVNGTVSGGGGGGTSLISTISATYSATAAQSIPTGVDTVVAFGVESSADAAVTRSTSGAGHKFTLAQTRLWVITATVRFSQNAVGGRRFDLVTGSGAVLSSASGPVNTDAPWTTTLACSRKLAAGTTVQVIARHNSSGSVSLEPASGAYVHIDLSGI